MKIEGTVSVSNLVVPQTAAGVLG